MVYICLLPCLGFPDKLQKSVILIIAQALQATTVGIDAPYTKLGAFTGRMAMKSNMRSIGIIDGCPIPFRLCENEGRVSTLAINPVNPIGMRVRTPTLFVPVENQVFGIRGPGVASQVVGFNRNKESGGSTHCRHDSKMGNAPRIGSIRIKC